MKHENAEFPLISLHFDWEFQAAKLNLPDRGNFHLITHLLKGCPNKVSTF